MARERDEARETISELKQKTREALKKAADFEDMATKSEADLKAAEQVRLRMYVYVYACMCACILTYMTAKIRSG